MAWDVFWLNIKFCKLSVMRSCSLYTGCPKEYIFYVICCRWTTNQTWTGSKERAGPLLAPTRPSLLAGQQSWGLQKASALMRPSQNISRWWWWGKLQESSASVWKMIMLNVGPSFQLHRQQQTSEKVETTEQIQTGVNMDAMEVLQVKRKKTMQRVKKSSTTTTTASFKSTEKKSSTSSSFALQNTINTSMSSKAAAIEDE